MSIVLLENWPLLVVHRCSAAKTRVESGPGCRFPRYPVVAYNTMERLRIPKASVDTIRLRGLALQEL